MSPSLTAEEEKRYAELQLMALGFARAGDTAQLEAMVAAGLPVNLADHKGNTLLMLATYNGNADTARMLIARGAEVDRRNDRGQTPLGGVSFKGDLALVRLLVEAGAEVDADNGGGMTPLMYATLFGRHETAAWLRTHGATHGRRTFAGAMARAVGALVGLFRRRG